MSAWIWQSVPCDKCGADRYEKCRSLKSGKVTGDIHAVRYERYYDTPGEQRVWASE